MSSSAAPARPAWIEVEDFRQPGGWAERSDAERRARDYCRWLEAGEILFFRGVPFELPAADREFLISQKQTGSRFHKNISYRPAEDVLRGAASDPADEQRLHDILRRYTAEVTAFLTRFLTPYAGAGRVQLDYASFRPLEEQGRDLPLHKRNDLLHVDAFPTRPTRGARILRVFTNIHPSQPRIWLTGEPFHKLAPQQAPAAGLEDYANAAGASGLRSMLRALGAPLRQRSAYDRFMLHFHDWLKENRAFQESSPKQRSEFPAGSTWMVYTDGVPHAALSGRYALEHTYIVPRPTLVAPELAPIAVLEKLSGRELSAVS